MKEAFGVSVALIVGLVIVGCGKATAAAALTQNDVYGTWIMDGTMCYQNCAARTLPDSEFMGQQLVLQEDRYENPLDGGKAGNPTCKTGVDVRSVKRQDGAAFVRGLPIGSGKATRRNPEEFGVTHQIVPSGIIICKGGGNLATVLLPTKNHLLIVEEGGVLASFHRFPANALNDAQALLKLTARLQTDAIYRPNCANFNAEGSTDDAFTYAVHEKHGDSCPGDPNTSPAVTRFRVLKSGGRIEWWDSVNNQWQPYETFIKTKRGN